MAERHVGEATHPEPAWRDRANFIIRGHIPGSEGHHLRTEQIWARQVGEFMFEVCCIPFHLYDVSLGDTVRTNPAFEIEETLARSGHLTFRVWLQDQLAGPKEVADTLEALGAALEWSGPYLLAVDAPNSSIGQAIADALWSDQKAGRLIYETGATLISPGDGDLS